MRLAWLAIIVGCAGAEAAAAQSLSPRDSAAALNNAAFTPGSKDAQAGSVRLTRCPLLEAAHRYPDVVCGVHLGLAQGALEAYGADLDGAALLPFAEPGACLLHLTAGRRS